MACSPGAVLSSSPPRVLVVSSASSPSPAMASRVPFVLEVADFPPLVPPPGPRPHQEKSSYVQVVKSRGANPDKNKVSSIPSTAPKALIDEPDKINSSFIPSAELAHKSAPTAFDEEFGEDEEIYAAEEMHYAEIPGKRKFKSGIQRSGVCGDKAVF